MFASLSILVSAQSFVSTAAQNKNVILEEYTGIFPPQGWTVNNPDNSITSMWGIP
jgi:hypothetical protein